MGELERVRIFEDEGELTIEICPVTDWPIRLRECLGPLLISVVTAEGTWVLLPLASSGQFLVPLLYLAFFGAVTLAGWANLIWFSFGHEQIVVRGGQLVVQRRLGMFATGRVYRLGTLKDIHTTHRLAGRFRLLRGRVGFRYAGRNRYMADRISREQARMLVRVFRRWLPKNAWTPVLDL